MRKGTVTRSISKPLGRKVVPFSRVHYLTVTKKKRESAIVNDLDYQIILVTQLTKSSTYSSFLSAVYEISLSSHNVKPRWR